MAIKNVFVNFNIGDGNNDGTTWANAFRTAAALETYMEGTLAAEDVVWVMNGTVTLNDNWDFSARDGTAAHPIVFIGVNSTSHATPTYADWSITNMTNSAGDDRPTFACGANLFKTGDHTKFFNIKFTTTQTYGVFINLACTLFNCKATNSSASANLNAVYLGNSYCTLISCELISTNGYCLQGAFSTAFFCYFHDSGTGVLQSGNVGGFYFCVFDTLTTGVNLASFIHVHIMNCTFYTCTTAVTATTSYASSYMNNVIDTVTDGFKWTTQTDTNTFWKNHVGNSVTDMWDLVDETNVPYKDNAVTGGAGEDPDFTLEASGNFSLETTSPCLDAALALNLGCGV